MCNCVHILLSAYVFSMVESRDPKFTKNENVKYTQQILGCNDIEHPNSENHNYIQIITSVAYLLHMIIFIFVI